VKPDDVRARASEHVDMPDRGRPRPRSPAGTALAVSAFRLVQSAVGDAVDTGTTRRARMTDAERQAEQVRSLRVNSELEDHAATTVGPW
jgi:hypothetical protein